MKPLSWTSGAWVLVFILGLTGLSCVTQITSNNRPLASAPRPLTSREPDAATKAKVQVTYSKLPLSFEANQGQTDEQVHFLSRGRGYTLFLTSTEAVLALRKPARHDAEMRGHGDTETFAASPTRPVAVSQSPPTPDLQPNKSSLAPVSGERARVRGLDPEPIEQTVLRMHFVGANLNPRVEGLDEIPGRVNYFIGNDPTKWRTNIPTYARVQYQDIYLGIDLVYYGNQGQLEYDLVVAPGADPGVITLAFDGLVGAGPRACPQEGDHRGSPLHIDGNGDLILHTAGGEIRLHKPRIYQEINGTKQAISGRYVFKDNYQIGFGVAAYDTSKPLIIDPVLSYSTYLGGSSDDGGWGIAVDTSGNAYVTGYTGSTDFPRVNPFQALGGGPFDVFVTKVNPTGSTLLYSTYLGGSSSDLGYGIAVDPSGNAYVTGQTYSTDFPTANPFQATFGGFTDAFVAKIVEGASTWIRFPLEGDWAPIRQGVGEWYQKYCGYHLAHDVACSPDTPVYPMADGMVKYARVTEGLGCAVHIEHQLPPDDPLGGMVVSVYYHLKRPRENSQVGEICLLEGSPISKDQPLGYVSGKKADYGDGPHLHFGIRKGPYQGGCDPRTKKWYYPGYTTIYKGMCEKPGQKECKSSNPVHQQILAEWISDPEDFIRSRGGQ